MKRSKISIAAFFLFASFTYGFAQNQDTIRTEKKIEGVVIRGTTNKGAEANLIQTQRRSLEVIERVGSLQLEKQGIGDVSLAVTKATGTQKQQGTGQIFVRGLGDRSNATSINGLLIPSNDPTFKNIDLSILKTDMIDYISLDKIYHPKLWGDVSGATVDIVSKIHTGKPYFKINLSSSANLSTLKQNTFYKGQGLNFFGWDGATIPTDNEILTQGFAFTKGTQNKEMFTPINSSLALDFGRNFNIGSEGRLSVFGYGAFENDHQYAKGTFGGSYDSGTTSTKLYPRSEEFKYATNTTGLINLNYRMNSRHTVNFTANYIHTTNQKLGFYEGHNRDFLDDPSETTGYTQMRRAVTKVNDLLVLQLRGDHKLSDDLKLNWNLGYNHLDSKHPDRQQNVSVFDRAKSQSYFASSNPGVNHRYFDSLIQSDYLGNLSLDYHLNDKAKVSVGYNTKYQQSDFQATQYNFRVKPGPFNYYVDPTNYDSFFNLANYQTGAYFDIVTFRGDIVHNAATALIPQFYQSEVFNNAGYANVDYQISDRFTGQLGVRVDHLDQHMVYNTAIFSNGGAVQKNYTKILPALNLKYVLSDTQNLRFSASKTYTSPLLIELAPFEYEDIDDSSYGNIDLYPSDNYNVDLKWEMFPKKSELISITAFAKLIQNPIARVTVASSANIASFVNVGDTGKIFGSEVEIRKDLYERNGTRLYAFANATYLHTSQDLDAAKVSRENTTVSVNFIKDKDKMTGASDFIANANLGWQQKGSRGETLDFVVSYSYISDNVYALGYEGLGNQIDKAINTLDAVAKIKLNNGIGLSLSGKNLLNPTFSRIQRNTTVDHTIREYKTGISIGAGVSYEF